MSEQQHKIEYNYDSTLRSKKKMINDYPSNICGNTECEYQEDNICLVTELFEQVCNNRMPPVLKELKNRFPFSYCDEMLCPYCGETQDEWDIVLDDAENGFADCSNCGNEFSWIVHRTESYTTKRKI